MVLSSQIARLGIRKGSRFKRRRRRRALLGILGITSVGIAGLFLMPSGEPTAPAEPQATPAPGDEAGREFLQPRANIPMPNPTVRDKPKRLAAPPPIIAATAQRPLASDPARQRVIPPPAVATVMAKDTEMRPVPPPPKAARGDPDLWRQVRGRLENDIPLVDPQQPLASRRWLTDALDSPALAPDEARRVREALTRLN